MKNDELNKIKEEIDKHSIISFDIFDTLLIRPFIKPVDLFYYIEEKYQITGYAQKRILSEKEIRDQLKDTEEISFQAIYDHMNSYKNIADIELDTEVMLLSANKDIFEIYQYALQKGRKVIITSDIYLPEDTILKALALNGYDKFSRLYLSSSVGKSKWSGNLFKFVLEDLKMTPEEILHIGDNYDSDFQRPQELGIHSLYYKNIIDRYYENNYRAKMYAEKYPNDINVSCFIMQQAIQLSMGYSSYWDRFGYEYAGIICYSFMKWLDNTLQKQCPEVKDILFIARDSYILQRVFNIVTRNKSLKNHYIYAPRLLNLTCRLDYNPNELHGMKTIIECYKSTLKIRPDSITSCEQARIVINNNIEVLRNLANDRIIEYKSYLTDLHIEPERTVMVDSVTGSFSAQKLICSVLENDISGLYYNVMESAKALQTDFHYFSYAGGSYNLYHCWDLIEFIMSAPEYPILSIKDSKPIYADKNKYESIRIKKSIPMHQSVLKFASDKINQKIEYNLDYENIADWINLFIENPTQNDVEAFNDLYHSVGSNNTDYRHLIYMWYDFPNTKKLYFKMNILEKTMYLARYDKKTLKSKITEKLKNIFLSLLR